METVRRRFWIASAIALAFGGLSVLTIVWRDWIEALTGLDPDHHSGSGEWLVVVGLGTCCVVVGFAARVEWRRAATALASSA